MTMDPRSASTAKKKAPGIFLSSFCVIIYVRIVTDNEISSGSIQLSYSNTIITYWLPVRPSDVLTRAAPPQRYL